MSLQVNETKPFTFFESNGVTLNNYSDNDVVITSDQIPNNHIGRLTDVNTIFTTSGGTLAFEKVSRSGGVTRWASAVTSNSNGSFDLMLMPGDKLRIVITSSGNGVIDILWHGELQRQKEDDDRDVFIQTDEFGSDL